MFNTKIPSAQLQPPGLRLEFLIVEDHVVGKARLAEPCRQGNQRALLIYQMLTLGGVEERLIAASDQLTTGESRPQFSYSWSVDGRSLLCSSVASQGNVNL